MTSVYYYHFDHVSSYSFADILGQGPFKIATQVALKTFGIHTTQGLGACHEDDNLHLFTADRLPYRRLDPNNQLDMATTSLMVDLWANFARYGEPTPESLPWGSEVVAGRKGELGMSYSNGWCRM